MAEIWDRGEVPSFSENQINSFFMVCLRSLLCWVVVLRFNEVVGEHKERRWSAIHVGTFQN